MALDPVNRQLYYGDVSRCLVRRIDMATNKVYRVAGMATGASGAQCGNYTEGASATASMLYPPTGLALDSTMTQLYISSFARVSVVNLTSGRIFTAVANISLGRGYSGDGGPATLAQLNLPLQMTTDSQGRLYIADQV